MSKTVLITGCSSGFGYHTAKLLAESGYTVYPTVRQRKDLKILPNTILLDVTWSQTKINKIINQLGRIDVLINNAGFAYLGATDTYTIKELEAQFAVNVFGAFKLIKAVLPSMHRQKSGLIININSVSGLVTTAFYGLYSASKFALEALTTSLRAEESLFGIQVVSVNPGSFATNFWSNVKMRQSPLNDRFAKLVNHPLHRRSRPDPVINTIKSIIENPRPAKNYIVGFPAQLLFFLHRVLPLSFQDWLVKFLIRRLA